MALFGRRGAPEPDPVDGFWAWWAAGGEAEVAAAAAAGAVSAGLEERVAALDPQLQWETGPAEPPTLTVSAAGDPALRRVAERWRRAAPAGSAWTFLAARAADPDVASRVLGLDRFRFRFAEVRIALDVPPNSTRLNVRVSHPLFPDVDDRTRGTVTFLLLDAALGEDDVERWLGHIEPVVDAGPEAEDVVALCNAVARLAARRPTGDDDWSLAQGQNPDGSPLVVRTRQWERWIDHPLLDLHTRIAVPYGEAVAGMPLESEGPRLAEIEQTLLAETADRAVLVTVQTGGTRRTFDLWSDSADPEFTKTLAKLGKRLGGKVEQAPDPTWRAARLLD